MRRIRRSSVTVYRRRVTTQDVVIAGKKTIGRIDRTIRRRLGRVSLDWSREPIATPRKRLDESRGRGRVAKDLPQPFDRRVQAVLEIHEDIVTPQFTTQVVARHQCAWRSNQERENTKRLDRQEKPAAVLRQLPRPQIQRELAESYELWLRSLGCHGSFRESGGDPIRQHTPRTRRHPRFTFLSPSDH